MNSPRVIEVKKPRSHEARRDFSGTFQKAISPSPTRHEAIGSAIFHLINLTWFFVFFLLSLFNPKALHERIFLFLRPSIRYIMSNKNYISSLFRLNEAIYFMIPDDRPPAELIVSCEKVCAINMRIDKKAFSFVNSCHKSRAKSEIIVELAYLNTVQVTHKS